MNASREARAIKPQVLKFQSGVDNRSREYALGEGAARTLTNVDVTRDGGLLCRKGTRQLYTGDFHSFFTHPTQRYALVVQDNVLQRLDPDHTLMALTPVSGAVAYAVLNDQVHWTDGSSVGLVTAQGELGTWGLNMPPAPIVSAVTNGGLFSGAYLVAMTAVDSTGLESPASALVTLNVVEGGGIEVVTPTASGVQFAIYRTTQNGPATSLRRATLADPGTTVLLGEAPLGKPLESLYAVRPFPGQCLVQHKGRLWCASGKVLWFTSEFSPHWLFPSQGYYQFESTIQTLSPSEDGIFVGLENRVLYLQGNNPAEMTQRPVSSVGAAAGSAMELPYDLFLGEGSFPSRQGAFLDRDGYLCIGKSGGILTRPTQSHYSAGGLISGIGTYRVCEGLRQVLFLAARDAVQCHWATDQSIQDVFTNGVTLDVTVNPVGNYLFADDGASYLYADDAATYLQQA